MREDIYKDTKKGSYYTQLYTGCEIAKTNLKKVGLFLCLK